MTHCVFLTSAPHRQALPEALYPEVAFWGRSNVGKSSLLNAIIGSGVLARVSKTPGCTQTINFYHCASGLRLVDLPGYGFAKVPLGVKNRWANWVTEYISQRGALWKIYVLIDARLPVQPIDRMAMDGLTAMGKRWEVVLTKSETISPTLLKHRQEALTALYPKVAIWPVSAKKNQGLAPIREFLGLPLQRARER
jgi:GTP-binding protein